MSEITLSKIISGVLGMVSFQGLGMIVYALSQDAMLAICAPMLILLSRATEYGVRYPNYLLGTNHTYGIIGIGIAVLVIGLIGAGRYRLGGFLLGAAPSIHPSLGLWLSIIV